MNEAHLLHENDMLMRVVYSRFCHRRLVGQQIEDCNSGWVVLFSAFLMLIRVNVTAPVPSFQSWAEWVLSCPDSASAVGAFVAKYSKIIKTT